MKHIKLFESWLNEAATKVLFSFDLQKEMPKEFNRESRLQDEEDRDEYTDAISTTLEAFDATGETPKEEASTFIHDSFKDAKFPVKLIYSDQEKGFGTYGPNGGGMEVTVYAGLENLDKKSILELFKTLWTEETDYFVA